MCHINTFVMVMANGFFSEVNRRNCSARVKSCERQLIDCVLEGVKKERIRKNYLFSQLPASSLIREVIYFDSNLIGVYLTQIKVFVLSSL